MSRASRPRLALVGAGKAAAAIAARLSARGYPSLAVASRRPAAASALARRIPGLVPRRTIDEAVAGATVILLAIPDREIGSTARALAKRLPDGWSKRVVLHLAGSLGVEPLAPLAARGAAVGVLHPLQVLGDAALAARLLPGSRARLEGSPRAVAAARRLGAELGLIPLAFRRALGPDDRAAYHAAASLAANDLVALVDLAAEILAGCGLGRREATAAAATLARGALEHLARGGTRSALTGPVARGDAPTLARQLRALDARAPLAAAAHRLLSRRILELAARGAGGIDRGAIEALLRVGPRGRRTV